MAYFGDTLKHAWNAFTNNKDPSYDDYSIQTSSKPDRIRLTRGNERTIITAVYNRIANDVADTKFRHVNVGENGNYIEMRDSFLNDCLTVETNKDQTPRAFIRDAVISLLDEGVVALVPIDTTLDPDTGSYDIRSIRVGKIVSWMPDQVKINVYNDRIGRKQDLTMNKRNVCIIENPFYETMNTPNSVLQRLIRKLALLDAVDEQASAGKLDLIIQLPYLIKTEARHQQAEQRRKELEQQLSGSKYGVAYTDGTEKVTQLNRSLENNIMHEIEYLTSMLYSQLNMTTSVLDGTANEETMMNYMSRVVVPLASAIADEMNRKFLTKTARTQRQSIVFFKDPFKFVPTSKLAELADKFTRNAILSSNEFRQIVGYKPVDDEKADELRNNNINAANGQEFPSTRKNSGKVKGEFQNGQE